MSQDDLKLLKYYIKTFSLLAVQFNLRHPRKSSRKIFETLHLLKNFPPIKKLPVDAHACIINFTTKAFSIASVKIFSLASKDSC